MKLRDLLILGLALLLLSTLVGVAFLFYLQNRPAIPAPLTPSAVTITTGTTAQPGTTAHDPKTPPPTSTLAAETIPPLMTPTPTLPPSPTPTPTPTSTPSPTPTPTATPTPEPGARLANAHRAKRNGNYAAARSEFQLVLDSPDGEQEAAEALYEGGVCAYLDGDYDAARDLLTQFMTTYPDDHRLGATHFYLGAALEGLGEYEAAIAHYNTYIERQDVLGDLIHTRIGNVSMWLGQFENAVESYKLALDRATDLGQQYDLREQIGLAYSAAGRYQDAVDWLWSVTERSENVYRLARIWYLIGETYRLSGQEGQAREAFLRAVNGDPRPGYAHVALQTLVESNVPVNEYQRGLIDYYAGSYGAAVAAFQRYIEATPEYNSDVHYYTALSFLYSGSFSLTLEECERMINAFSSAVPYWEDMWLIKGQAFAGMEQIDAAVKTYLDFADAYPTHPLAAQARWDAAWLLETEDRFAEAADTYTALADRHSNDDLAPTARFRAGICRYRSQDADAALIAWQELLDTYPAASEVPATRYWTGKVLWSQERVQEAQSILQALADDHPRHYYGLRAAHLLANQGRPAPWIEPPARLHLTNDEAAEKQEAAAWLRTWAGLPDDADPSRVSVNLADDIRFRRGMELITLGLRSQATTEFESLRQDLYQDPLLLYQFATLTRDLGLYGPSLRAAINLITLAPEAQIIDMPRQIQRLVFPTYFSDLVLAESNSYELDPLLMFALIRQESVFDDQIDSWAGAVGLTQVMPSTGAWIAEMMPWPGYRDDLLKRAYVNVKFGAWFLSRALEGTEGDVMAALAGYNGGPGNGVYWLKQSGGDPDLFVEVITRDEPQRYVREIYRHYDMYVYLYGEK